MLVITLVALFCGAIAIYIHKDRIKYSVRHMLDDRSSHKYVMINNGAKATNSLDVELRVTNKSNKANYISYRSCYAPVKGKKQCGSWTPINDTPFHDYMGKEINSDEAWRKTVRLYDKLPDDQLQGRHIIEVRYFYKKDVISAALGDRNVLLETKSSYIYYDTIAPSISATSLNGWINDDYLTIKYSDNGVAGEKYVSSGVDKISYQLCLYYEVVGSSVICNETPETVNIKPNKFSKKFKIGLQLSSSYLTVSVTDLAGNTTVFQDILKKDNNSPIVTIVKNKNEETGQVASITVNASDSKSMISSVKYTFTGSNMRPNDKEFENELEAFDDVNIELPTKNKKYYLWIRAEDYAGNVTYSSSGAIYVCDSVEACSDLVTNKSNYLTLLYICIGVAVASLVSIIVIMSKKKGKE